MKKFLGAVGGTKKKKDEDSSSNNSPVMSPGGGSLSVSTGGSTGTIKSDDDLANLPLQNSKTSVGGSMSSSTTQTPTVLSPIDSVPKLHRNVHSGGKMALRLERARNLVLPTSNDAGEVKIFCHIEYDQNEEVIDATDVSDATAPIFKKRVNFDVSNAERELTVTLWIKRGSSKPQAIGQHVMVPSVTDGQLNDECFKLTTTDDNAAGELHVHLSFIKPDANKRMVIEDYDLLKVIGKGSFGKVMQVRKKDTLRIYAMKIIRKANIIERDEVEHTIAERNVLAKINHPFIVNLKLSFQTSEKLYLVLAFVNGGELFKHLQDDGQFDEYRSKFYTAELLLALEHLHKFNIIYRDLKPENILLDCNGHIALCDFGLCKLHMTNGEKTNTFCGTPEYLAPELLIGEGYTKTVDWWTLGILLYEMITGLPPYYSDDVNEMYRKILHDELTFPPEVSASARSLLTQLLDRDPQKRLGANGAADIKKHPFFGDINWERLFNRKVAPPFRPDVSSLTDTSNFDAEFTELKPEDSLVETSQISESEQERFDGFTYVDESKMTYAATPSMRVHPKGL